VAGTLDQRKSRILIIDDSEADLFLVKEALRREGLDCDIVSITDGAQAIAFLCGPDAPTCPDCILLDINLPKVGGDQVLRTIREHAPTADVPILVWSSSLRTETDSLKDQTGPAIFMEKPTELREFLAIGAKIRALLDGSAQREIPLP
jgi:CheY-like chemotaxis protein